MLFIDEQSFFVAMIQRCLSAMPNPLDNKPSPTDQISGEGLFALLMKNVYGFELAFVVNKFKVRHLVIVEVISDNPNRVLTIYRVARIEREALLAPGEHIITQLRTIGGVVIRVKRIVLDIIRKMVTYLRRDLDRGASSVCVSIGKGIGVQEVSIRIKIQSGIHRCVAEHIRILSIDRVHRFPLRAQILGWLKKDKRLMFSIGEAIQRRRPVIVHLHGTAPIIRDIYAINTGGIFCDIVGDITDTI